MSGRIATIGTAVATLGDYRSRALLGDATSASEEGANNKEGGDEAPSPEPLLAQADSPAPAEPSASPFDAAIVASRLEAPSSAEQQLLMRRKGSWSPPDSDLHLTDRIA